MAERGRYRRKTQRLSKRGARKKIAAARRRLTAGGEFGERGAQL
jgi:hypothetical protein